MTLTNRLEEAKGASRELSPARIACLRWYAKMENNPVRVCTDNGWNSRQMNWCLEHGFLTVGRRGWHVPSEKATALLKALQHKDTE